jgi:ABC-type phosphonate transport system ATPase subunit
VARFEKDQLLLVNAESCVILEAKGSARMKHLAVIALVALGTCLVAKAQSRDTAKELIAAERSFSDALLRADWKMVEQIEADELVFTNADGSVTHRSDDVGGIKSGDTKFRDHRDV